MTTAAILRGVGKLITQVVDIISDEDDEIDRVQHSQMGQVFSSVFELLSTIAANRESGDSPDQEVKRSVSLDVADNTIVHNTQALPTYVEQRLCTLESLGLTLLADAWGEGFESLNKPAMLSILLRLKNIAATMELDILIHD